MLVLTNATRSATDSKRVEVLVLAEERLPLVAGIAPAWSPQCVQVALGQPEPDRHDVSSHAAQPNDGPWLAVAQASGVPPLYPSD